eukprot:13154243-Ditylum_brightwellii.AAC.1
MVWPCDKVNSSSAQHCCLTYHQLHHYLGHQGLCLFKSIEQMAAKNIMVVDIGEVPLELRDFAKIAGSRRNKNPVPIPYLSSVMLIVI